MPQYRYQYYQQDRSARQGPGDESALLLVESGVWEVTGEDSEVARTVVLEELWAKHNRPGRPHGQAFCSMSEGDVVLLSPASVDEYAAYLCAPVGWEPLPDFQLPSSVMWRTTAHLARRVGEVMAQVAEASWVAAGATEDFNRKAREVLDAASRWKRREAERAEAQ